jgi:proteasome activator subunit 4
MKGALWTLNAPSFGTSWLPSHLNTFLCYLLGKYVVGGGPDCLVNETLPNSGSEPTLVTEFMRRLFGCEHNEKVNFHSQLQITRFSVNRFRPRYKTMSVRSLKLVSILHIRYRRRALTLSEGLSSFIEACYLVYDIENPAINPAVQNLLSSIASADRDDILISRCRDKRIERVRLLKEALQLTVCDSFCVT